MVRIDQARRTIADVERHLAGGRDVAALDEVKFAQALLTGARGELEHLTAKGPTPFPQRNIPAPYQVDDDG